MLWKKRIVFQIIENRKAVKCSEKAEEEDRQKKSKEQEKHIKARSIIEKAKKVQTKRSLKHK